MKKFKLGWVVMAVTLFILGMTGSAMAFHDGGVARCAGCHTMHNSQDGGAIVGPNAAVPASALLGYGAKLTKGSDPSSTCLACHAGYGQFTTDGSSRGSGGDFYWLTQDFAAGRTNSPGETHGHNIIALDFAGLETGDSTLATAPGGTYSSAGFSCASCHDPHGREGNPLLLWGNDPQKGKQGFTADVPAMGTLSRRTVVPASTATSPGGYVGDDNHVTYGVNAAGDGISAWCANCHSGFTAQTMHPAGVPLGDYATKYNDYVSTGVGGGVQATAFTELVPFERNTTDQAVLDAAKTSTAGPNANDRVMCLSCHRAHATPFGDAGRWDFSASLLYESVPNTVDVPNAYYGRSYLASDPIHQRSLCNKCHVQD